MTDPKSSESIADRRREWRQKQEEELVAMGTMPSVVFDAEPKVSFDGWAFPELDDNESLSATYKAQVRADFEVAIDEAVRNGTSVMIDAPHADDYKFLEPLKPHITFGFPLSGDRDLEAVASLDGLIAHWIDQQSGADGLCDKGEMDIMAQYFRRWADRCDQAARR